MMSFGLPPGNVPPKPTKTFGTSLLVLHQAGEVTKMQTINEKMNLPSRRQVKLYLFVLIENLSDENVTSND
jgi:hypothetical protein